MALYAAAMAATACASASTVARPSPFPSVSPPSSPARGSLTSLATARVITDALALQGTPYRLGGDEPAVGLDCSGLVRYVFMVEHVELPRTVAEQYRIGT